MKCTCRNHGEFERCDLICDRLESGADDFENNLTMTEITNQREYDIKKGKVLESFNEKFHERYKHNDLYRNVREMLIRDANPYEIIEKVIEINDKIFSEMKEMMPYVSPNYSLNKQSLK